MGTPTIEFLPVSNGDMTLITTKNGKRILIDCNYRQPTEEITDVKEMLRERLVRNNEGQLFIDVFLITHPDKDHTLGFRELFHWDAPASEWNEEEDKIIINELWSSPRVFRRASRKPDDNGVANNTLTEDAKAINKEAKRRANLFKETKKIGELGDRIVIMTHDEDGKTEGYEGIVADIDSEFISQKSGVDDSSLQAYLLGPADKQFVEAQETVLSKNNSSTIINFTLTDDENNSYKFLNGGDAAVKCWEHLYERLESKGENELSQLNYDVLQAPHHCSWRTLSEDSESGDENPSVNDKAKNALSGAQTNSLIVSSSREFGEATPPSNLAKNVYEEILDGVGGDFLCVADEEDSDGKPASLLIELKNGQPERRSAAITFSQNPNPTSVKKGGKNTYA